MELYSSYEVRINGIPSITTGIADSDCLLVSFLDKLKGLISDLKLRNQRARTTKPIVVGLNVEYDSSYESKPAILQVCFDTQCVIIQLHRLEISLTGTYLNNFFAVHKDIVFVGVGIQNKLEKLETTYMLQCSKDVFELGSLADRVCRKHNLFKSKLEELALEIVGIEIKKPNSLNLAAWFMMDLTSEQIEYATLIAYASYAVGNKLLAGSGNNILA